MNNEFENIPSELVELSDTHIDKVVNSLIHLLAGKQDSSLDERDLAEIFEESGAFTLVMDLTTMFQKHYDDYTSLEDVLDYETSKSKAAFTEYEQKRPQLLLIHCIYGAVTSYNRFLDGSLSKYIENLINTPIGISTLNDRRRFVPSGLSGEYVVDHPNSEYLENVQKQINHIVSLVTKKTQDIAEQ